MPKRGGDGISMLSRVPEPLVNTAHIQKINDWQTWPAMSVPGPSLQKRDVRATSAFPLIATQERTSRDVSNVPLADIQLVADGDLGDVGILRVSWPFSRIAAIKTIPAAAWV
jgi:hypothetical protein